MATEREFRPEFSLRPENVFIFFFNFIRRIFFFLNGSIFLLFPSRADGVPMFFFFSFDFLRTNRIERSVGSAATIRPFFFVVFFVFF